MARPGFVAYLFVVQCTTAVLCRCFYIRFVLPLINITKILFVDDKAFKVIDNIKEKNGWKNVSRIVDVESLSQTEIQESHIIFVDIQGVGKKMNFKDGGLGLIVALKKEYPDKKIVMYSAESQGQIDAFHPAAELVDARLRKTASLYEFISTVERLAKEAFCLDNCVKHLKVILRREFGIEKDETEITKIITDLYDNEGYKNQNTIASAFSLSNAGSIASIIQLLLM